MADERDDDALSWAGEDADPTLVKSVDSSLASKPSTRSAAQRAADARAASRSAGDASSADSAADPDDPLGAGAGAGGDGTGDTGDDDADAAIRAQAASSALLVTIGIAAGVYLLYTIGWLITLTRQSPQITSIVQNDPVGQFMYGLGLWLAVAAAPLWFLGTLLLTRRSAARTRILWFVIGVVVVAPLPFVRGF